MGRWWIIYRSAPFVLVVSIGHRMDALTSRFHRRPGGVVIGATADEQTESPQAAQFKETFGKYDQDTSASLRGERR